MCCASHPFLSFNFIFFFNKHFLSICFCFSFFHLSSISPTQWVKSSCLEQFSGFFKNRTFWKVLAGSGGGSWGWDTYQVNWQRDSRYIIHLQKKQNKTKTVIKNSMEDQCCDKSHASYLAVWKKFAFMLFVSFAKQGV